MRCVNLKDGANLYFRDSRELGGPLCSLPKSNGFCRRKSRAICNRLLVLVRVTPGAMPLLFIQSLRQPLFLRLSFPLRQKATRTKYRNTTSIHYTVKETHNNATGA
jgi:hypothetical protein